MPGLKEEIKARNYAGYWREALEQQGRRCKSCQGKALNWAPSQQRWICKRCKTRTGLRCGTFMEHSPVPVWAWLHVALAVWQEGPGVDQIRLYQEIGELRLGAIRKCVGRVNRAIERQEDDFSCLRYLAHTLEDSAAGNDAAL
ncbi:MAG: hypothetical protein RI842_05185 [Schleiferiaceae bacterium]|jgi:hypothetical protein|nr:hypothetical protein [Schleiferiaceae bacterium]MDR9442091.1 hypothetical protein [Schleiferiaceae bacterium]